MSGRQTKGKENGFPRSLGCRSEEGGCRQEQIHRWKNVRDRLRSRPRPFCWAFLCLRRKLEITNGTRGSSIALGAVFGQTRQLLGRPPARGLFVCKTGSSYKPSASAPPVYSQQALPLFAETTPGSTDYAFPLHHPTTRGHPSIHPSTRPPGSYWSVVDHSFAGGSGGRKAERYTHQSAHLHLHPGRLWPETLGVKSKRACVQFTLHAHRTCLPGPPSASRSPVPPALDLALLLLVSARPATSNFATSIPFLEREFSIANDEQRRCQIRAWW